MCAQRLANHARDRAWPIRWLRLANGHCLPEAQTEEANLMLALSSCVTTDRIFHIALVVEICIEWCAKAAPEPRSFLLCTQTRYHSRAEHMFSFVKRAG
jgi:hypothetical protein